MKIQASFLWRESIEILYNVRKGNAYKELPWNCIPKYLNTQHSNTSNNNIEDFCNGQRGSWGLLGTGVGLKIAMGTGNEFFSLKTGDITNNFETNFETFRLYELFSGDYITYVYSWECIKEEKENGYSLCEDTPFARYVIFKALTESWTELPTDKVVKVESHILYNNSSLLTGEEVIETILGNYDI